MIAWNDCLLLPWESAWSVGQKIAWLNGGTPREALRPICRKWHDLSGSAVHPVGSKAFWWPENCGAQTDPEKQLYETLSARFWRGSEAANWCEEVGFGLAEHVRYCPTCLEGGFHSIVHQIAGIARCPIDGAKLADGCPKCHADLGAPNLIDSIPFECRFCDHKFRDPRAPFFRINDEGAAERERRLKLVGTWAATAMRMLAPDEEWMKLRWVDVMWQGRRTMVPMRTALMGLCDQMIPFPLERDYGPPTLNNIRYNPDVELNGPVVVLPVSDIKEAVRVVKAELKSMLGGHGPCYDAGASLMREGYELNPWCSIPWYEHFCPRAYALLAWEKRANRFVRSLQTFASRDELRPTYASLDYLYSALRNLYEYSLTAARFAQWWQSLTNCAFIAPAYALRHVPWLVDNGIIKDRFGDKGHWSSVSRLSMIPDTGFWYDRCDGGLVYKYLQHRRAARETPPRYADWVMANWTPTTVG